MEGRRRRLSAKAVGAWVAAGCAIVLFPVSSQAATGGLVYKVSKLKPLPAGKLGTASVGCPANTSVVGGGIEIDGVNTATGMQSSYPFDGGDADVVPDDGWRGVANSRSAGNKSMVTFAVCAPGRYRYISRLKTPVANNSQAQIDAPCPAGRSVAGGGVKLSFGGSNTTSYIAAGTVPYDLTGDGTMDGWRAVANNQSGINQDLTAYAICAVTGTYRYRLAALTVSSGTERSTGVLCPKQFSVTAGGVLADTLDVRAEVATSRPFDGGDGDMVMDDGWRGAINNNSPADAELRTYAVCRKIT